MIGQQKTILITGVNRGIGKEITRQLIELGQFVVGTVRESVNTKGLKDLFGEKFTHLEMDVTDHLSILKAYEEYRRKFNFLDVLINNAAVIDSHDLAQGDIAGIRFTMDVNFFGPMQVNKVFLPALMDGDSPRIINISSGMGALDSLQAGNVGYRLSKAGLNAQTIILSEELKAHNISVNAVCPGWVKTDMGGPGAPRDVVKGAETPVWLAMRPDIPTGKFFRDKQIISW